jgi:dUTP pyrophosphatase
MKIKIVATDEMLPKYALDGDAGADLRAAEAGQILPGERLLVRTGVSVELPAGVAAFVHPRSGMALKYGITVLNTPGTIDSNYRGEIGVILYNASKTNFVINVGDRIAQLVFQEVLTVQFEQVSSLDTSDRGTGGFGSTGTN